MPYSELIKLTSGTNLQAHHIIPARFADNLGVKARDMLAIPLNSAEHQPYTNAWRAAIPYGKATQVATPEEIYAKAKEIYENSPGILKALGL